MYAFWHFVVEQWKQTSWWEIAADVTGLIGIWLVVKNKISTWAWSIVSVLLFGWVFWKGHLYANAGLQIFCFLPLSIYGWWAWLKFGPLHHNDLPITLLSTRARVGWLLVTVLLCIALSVWMARINDPAPGLDGTTTGISIVGQILQARKWYENWALWIVVNTLYLYLLATQHLYLTTALYFVFVILAVQGAVEWRRLMAQSPA